MLAMIQDLRHHENGVQRVSFWGRSSPALISSSPAEGSVITTAPHIVHVGNGRLGDSTRDDMRTTVRALAAGVHGDCLLVHFHGGLVNRADGLAMASRLDPIYRSAGACPRFFVWESGPIKTLTNVLTQVGRERAFVALLRLVLSFACGKLAQAEGRRGVGPIPVDEGELGTELAWLGAAGEPCADQHDTLPADAALEPGEEAQFRAALEQDDELLNAGEARFWGRARLITGAVKVLVRCIRRFAGSEAVR
jgi:hypothetical protein